MTFASDWSACMSKKGMPVPTTETADEALELLHQLHSAAENAGVEPGQILTIGTLIASGGLSAVGEGTLVILAGVAQTAVAVYVAAGISCVFAVAALDIKRLFASNDLPEFVADELSSQGIDLEGEAVA
jgi:alanine dehydrogenase